MRTPGVIITAFVLALFLATPTFAQKGSVSALFRNDFNVVMQQASTVPISVQHGADFGPLDQTRPVAPDTFVSIFGPVSDSSAPAQGAGGSGSLVNVTGDWGQSFMNGMAPTDLNGVRVEINGAPVPISFTGLGADFSREFDQINAVAGDVPPEMFGEDITVSVFKDDVLVGTTTVVYGEFSPAFFTFGTRNNVTYLAAAQADFSAFVAPSDFFGVPEVNGIPVLPAQSGDQVSFFATGFGQTTPSVAVGQIVTEVTQLNAMVEIRIGGMPAAVGFAGRAPNLADVYQFNAAIPAGVPDGDAEVEAEIIGTGLTTALGHIPIDNSISE